MKLFFQHATVLDGTRGMTARPQCDVLVENGRIVAHGTHEELLKTSEAYRDLYESQTQGVQA